jgi:DeoR/GlpR family transcriptional regulator of sugar metabolism
VERGQITGGINRDDWLAALGDIERVDDQSALTVREFAKVFGYAERTARKRLDVLVESGKATVTSKRVPRAASGPHYVTAYKLVERKRKK